MKEIPQDIIWLDLYAAALQGGLAAEGEHFQYEHRQRAAESCAHTADYALAEFNKRWRNHAQSKG